MDAQETVDALVADVAHLPEPNKDTLEEVFRQHRIQVHSCKAEDSWAACYYAGVNTPAVSWLAGA